MMWIQDGKMWYFIRGWMIPLPEPANLNIDLRTF